MFLFELHWISSHSQLAAELDCGKSWLNVVFQVLQKLWPIICLQLDQFCFVNIRCCVSWMTLLAVYTSNFFQAIFLHVVWVLFTIFGICVVLYRLLCGVHIFGIWSTTGLLGQLLNSLKIIADFHLLESMGLIKCQDVSVGLHSFYVFSDGDSYICICLFSQGLMISPLL